MTYRCVGTNVERRLNLPLLTGQAHYVADVHRPGELHARVVRSSRANARLTRVDPAAALAHPKVAAVITAADLPDVRIPIHTPFVDTAEARQFLQPPLTREAVHYVGMVDRVAAELGLDPVELRRRNLIPAESLPFRFDLGSAPVPPIAYDSGDFPAAFATLLGEGGYEELRRDRAARSRRVRRHRCRRVHRDRRRRTVRARHDHR